MTLFQFVGAVFVVIFDLFISPANSIIFNQLSGRCIYIPKEPTKVTALNKSHESAWNVYALPCTWDVKKNNTVIRRSMPEEWLEIIPSPSRSSNVVLTEERFVIRKVGLDGKGDEEVCMISRKGQPLASTTCTSPDAEMWLETQESTRKAPGRQFKIVDRNGLCLTAQLGKADAIFKECTRRYGLQQRWLVCRHNKICDTDFMWTPRKISFSSSTKEMKETKPDETLKVQNKENDNALNPCKPSPNYHQNEVLYSIQNGLQVYESGEDFVVSSIASFYPLYSLLEAQELVKKVCQTEKVECTTCKTYSKSEDAYLVTKWLVLWMEHCNTEPASKTSFLSRNVLHVPHFFPRQQLHENEQHKNVDHMNRRLIATLKKYLAELEDIKVRENEEANESTSLPQTNESSGINASTMHSNINDPDIDIRFGNIIQRNVTGEK